MRRFLLLFPFLAILLALQGVQPSLFAGATEHAAAAHYQPVTGHLSSGVLAYQPAYPLSVVVPVFEVRNAPDSQRITFSALALATSLPRSTPCGYEKLSKYLVVSLTGVDLIFPFHTFW